jgi:hypothetical protein
MSIINISVTDQIAAISVDNVCWDPGFTKLEIIEANDPSDLRLSEMVNSRKKRGKANPTALPNTTRLAVLPHMKAITAFAGKQFFGLMVRNYLTMCQCDDIAEFEAYCAEELQHLANEARRQGIYEGAFLGALIGFSKSENRMIGFQFRDMDDFKPHRFQYPHCAHPPLNSSDSLYGALYRKFENPFSESSEQELLNLHLELSQNQHRAYDDELYGPTWYCGDNIMAAVMTKDKITITEKNIIQGH